MNTIKYVFLFSALIGQLALITGCQTAGTIVATEKSTVCPECKIETVTAPIKGLTYKRHSCPHCKQVSTHEHATEAAIAEYTGVQTETVHVCEKCSSIVEPCPVCIKQ
jgi:hypothetical protein